MISGGNVTMVNSSNNPVFASIMRRAFGQGNNHDGHDAASAAASEDGGDRATTGRGRASRVCCSLFGPTDRQEQRRFLDEQWTAITQEENRRWNFNFQTGTPLPGRLAWEETTATTATATTTPAPMPSSRRSAADAAAALTREILARIDGDTLVVAAAAGPLQAEAEALSSAGAVVGSESTDAESSLSSDASASSSSSFQASSPLPAGNSQTAAAPGGSGSRMTVQPNITDMFPSRKRSSSIENATSDKVAANQQTAPPTKRSRQAQ